MGEIDSSSLPSRVELNEKFCWNIIVVVFAGLEHSSRGLGLVLILRNTDKTNMRV